MITTKEITVEIEGFNDSSDEPFEILVTCVLSEDYDKGDYYTPSYREVRLQDVLDCTVDNVKISYEELDAKYYTYVYNKNTKKFDKMSIDQYLDFLDRTDSFADEEFTDEDCRVWRY